MDAKMRALRGELGVYRRATGARSWRPRRCRQKGRDTKEADQGTNTTAVLPRKYARGHAESCEVKSS